MFIITTLICMCISCLIYYFHHSFSYWKRKGVTYIQPYFPLGSISLNFGKYGSQSITQMYSELKSTGAKYGGFYIFTVPVFMPVHPEIIKDILTSSFEHFHDRGIYHDEELDPLSANIFTLGGQKWKNMRSKLTPTFSSGKIKKMLSIVLACSENMNIFLENTYLESKVLDIKELAAGFTTDVIASCAFGIECNSIMNPNTEFRKYGRIFLDNNLFQKTKLFFGLLMPSVLRKLNIPFIKPMVSKYFIWLVKETMSYREKNNISRLDFFDLLIRIKNNENIDDDAFMPKEHGPQVPGSTEGITPAQIAAQALLFYLAGFETSSTTITFCLFELAQHQDIQDTLRQEIMHVLKKYDGKLTYEGIMEMQFLDKVINETLRKYPAVFMLNRICTKDYNIGGIDTVIEKGTRVIVPVVALHRDSEFYPNPDIFDPNRFSDEETSKRIKFTYIPFGEGPRYCIGIRFGILQTKIGIISMLKQYRYSVHASTKLPLELVSNIVALNTKDTIYLSLKKL